MYSLAQLATAAGVTVPTVRKHIKDGNLEANNPPACKAIAQPKPPPVNGLDATILPSSRTFPAFSQTNQKAPR